MNSRVIPLIDTRELHWRQMAADASPEGTALDTRGRRLHDLRISVTDRCNFRCVYCMPRDVFNSKFVFLRRQDLLTFEEITRLARQFVARGVEKIRLTGGEPLLRKGIERLVEMLSGIELPSGDPLDLTLTTNGSLLERMAAPLKAAGLRRVTVSLDALDDAIFRRMNDADYPVSAVLRGIDAAERAGLAPLKINAVIKRGVNDSQIVELARHFKGTGHIVRFIEFMDVGTANGWRLDDVVPSAEVVARIANEYALEPVESNYSGEVAQRWRYQDGSGEIGVISSVTQVFCNSCTRARLSADGYLYTCLFATAGTELRTALRTGASDAELANIIASIWRVRADRYSEIRSAATLAMPKIQMSYIGG